MAQPTRLATSSEPLHIFQDEFPDHIAPTISRAPMPSMGKPVSPRRALASTDANAVLQPPNGLAKQPCSPFKAGGKVKGSPLTPLRRAQNSKLNAVSIFPPNEAIIGSTDSLPKKQPLMSRFKTVAQKPSMESTLIYGKENMHPIIYPAPLSFNVNLEGYFPKASGKRGLLEAAPIKDSRPLKKAKVEDSNSFDCIPMLADDGSKPNHSYAQLIGMAILRAPHRRLTLAQIYKWISDSYSFYKADDAGWQNSIRHNLSLNKAFIKQERPKDDPGKGNYWAIEPGMEQQFTKEKSKKAASGAENVPVMSMSTRLEPAQVDHTVYQHGLPSLPPVLPMQPQLPPQNVTSLQAAPLPAPEISSDATIPMSDNVCPEEHNIKQQEQELPSENSYSPLPAMMHSSPPIVRHMEARSNTPPPASRGSRSSQKHKRKYASMDASLDDSGYISSLDSSVMRSNQAGRLLTSEADRPRSKGKRSRAGGRAEEEIARLRASSYESPSRGRSHGGALPSSSPLRQQHDSHGQMLPPLTPAVKFKVPPKPPASVSPNTNLRLHRDKVNHMLNSPLRRVSNMSEDMPWSPAFRLDDSLFHMNDLGGDTVGFDIWDDAALDTFFTAADCEGSPIKRSTKRAAVGRTSSADALHEITKSGQNKGMTSVPLLKAPTPPFSLDFETPSKAFEGLSSPMKAFLQSPTANKAASAPKGQWTGLEDICTQLFEDDQDDGAVDILQGFEKIGSSQNIAGPSKPSFGRSRSTMF